MNARPSPTIPADRPLFSIERSAQLLALSEERVLSLVYTGHIRAKRLSGNGIGITRRALLDYLASGADLQT